MNFSDLSPQSWQERLGAADPTLRVHLLGIGGAGLAPIATVLHERGVIVSGSDAQSSARTETLQRLGMQVYPSQSAENLASLSPDQRPHLVLISSAVGADNPERLAAEGLGIPVVKRREFLVVLLSHHRVIAVAGTHGKSTTTAMIVHTLHENGIDAGYIIGADLPGYGNAHAGSADWFVIEADEYDRMFLGLTPQVSVITNVEWDHPDCYPTEASFQRAFAEFVDQTRHDGLVISCADDDGAEELRTFAPSRGQWISYGMAADAELRAIAPVVAANGCYSTEILWWGAPLVTLALCVPGIHNVWNAMAALAVARYCGVPVADAAAALGRYAGIARRFEWKGEANGVTVIDDYAHHPTEVLATLAAARARFGERRIWAIFQPHTFSRTREMLHEMAASFAHADRVIVTDIYAAREKDDGTLTATDLVAASKHPAIQHIGGLETIADHLAKNVTQGDVVLTLGAGTSYRIGEMLLDRLGK
ncbi:MAG: UDP-N-acetylmuramate--L-alanine ligase [Chloroflexi bacterium]|nr:MAG: UDP-N-acetylmuramate--L-alanine ligase [Chloroflexota bacterium]